MSIQRFIPFVVCLIVAIVSASMLIDYGIQSARRKRDNTQLAESYESAFVVEEPVLETPEPTPETPLEPLTTPQPAMPAIFRKLSGDVPAQAQKLYKQNNDLAGWLYIKGVVSLPVVYRDNDYYLYRDFNRKDSKGGTLFLDQLHPLREETQHLVIHGHNMQDSSMFGIVSNYHKLPYVKNHGFARFSTMYAPEEYVLYAVLRVGANPTDINYFPYLGTSTFATVEEFDDFTYELKQKSLFDIPIDIQPSDAMLTLSTCIDDERLIVVFRKIRAGESKAELQKLLDQAIKY